MRRRQFLRQFAASTGALSCSQFLSYFATFGLPRAGRAEAAAAEVARAADTPRFLVYWFLEGGWMGYDMFNPVMTPNHVVNRLENPSAERYRILKWGEDEYTIRNAGNIRYGYLAEEGRELFPDMAVLSSMHTGSFHSGDRLKTHMGDYSFRLTDEREDDERSILQAFAEAYGQPYVLPNVEWHLWLSDGELNEAQYTGRRGYYHALGPSHAHTIYGETPEKLRDFLMRMQRMSSDPVNAAISGFLDNAESEVMRDSNSEVVKSYHSARTIYQNLAGRGASLDPVLIGNMFNDRALKEEFGVRPADELITYRSINGNKARSKFTPAVNVQTMMAWELMRAGLSCAFWIESQGIRGFDHHYSRGGLWRPDGTPVGLPDTTEMMRNDLWKPLKTLVKRLKETEYRDSGRSYFDLTTIVLTSEFGRSIHGDVDAILKMPIPESDKKKMVNDQDISQHWRVTSCAFLGGSVRGDSQFGRVGEHSLGAIPILPDGSLDPNFDAVTGELLPEKTKHDQSFIPNHGDVYATALHLSGLNPAGRGRNTRPAMKFIGKS